jgi:hypothetical protein
MVTPAVSPALRDRLRESERDRSAVLDSRSIHPVGVEQRLIALADVTLETLFWEWKGGRASFKFSPLNST